VVQDDATGAVLMLAWANAEALAQTLATGRATFWSRSRQRLWVKGETSGNAMDVSEVREDCDGDTLLYRVRPHGPACHTGQATCFFRDHDGADVHGGPPPATLVEQLERVIDARRGSDDAASYTALLWRRGEGYVAGKVTEEAAEVVDAAATRTPEALAEEAADLVFHLLALLRMKGVAWADVLSVLRARRASHGRGAKD
jgi:phosphoribosyl-ATP pyrophosphohydrolase/phosphoribosyl-AMP cyclohydrolase